MTGKIILTFILFSVIIDPNLFSQVTGRVYDSNLQKPIPGATIIDTLSNTGTTTNADGYFELSSTENFIVGALGYEDQYVEAEEIKRHYVINLKPSHYELNEVMVSAFNVSRRLIETPGSVTLIPAHEIQGDRETSISNTLNRVPGIFAHKGALNTGRITIRGIGSRIPYATGKIRAYINEIPLTGGNGETVIEDIDPAIIERVEVIKGPATSVYGAGLGGTINITARRKELHDNNISNTFVAGSYGMVRNTLSTDLGNDRLNGSIIYNHTAADGYRENNEYNRDAITFIGRYNTTSHNFLTGFFSYISLFHQIPSSIDSATYHDNPRSAAGNWLRTEGYEEYDKILTGISYQHNFNRKFKAGISIFTTYKYMYEVRPFNILTEDKLNYGSRMKLTYSGMINRSDIQLILGGELFNEDFTYKTYENIDGLGPQGSRLTNNLENTNYYNLFFQADLNTLQSLTISAGINMNNSYLDYSDLQQATGTNYSGEYGFGIILSPRISLNYRYLPRHAAFFTISHGFSPPSLAETLTPEGHINPDIKPEKSWNYEAGFRGSLFNRILFYDLSLFYMNVSDLLVAERVGEDAFVGRNAGQTIHKGIETEIDLILLRKSNDIIHGNEISIYINTAINDFRFADFSDHGIDYSGNFLPGVPRQTLSAGINIITKPGIYGKGEFQYVGKMPITDDNTLLNEAYKIFNFRIGYKVILGNKLNLDLFTSVNNAFNKKYSPMVLINAPSFGNVPPRYYYPGFPVNYTAGLSLRYIIGR